MNVQTALLLAGFQLAAALLGAAGVRLGYWDQDVAVRITMVAIGVMLLFNGNFASKTVSRLPWTIAAHRFLGWSMTLGAVIWTSVWLFAPMEVARVAAPGAVVVSLLVAVANGFRVRPKTTA